MRKPSSKDEEEGLTTTAYLADTNAVAGPSTASTMPQGMDIPPRSDISPSAQMYTGSMAAPINSLGSQESPLLRMGEFGSLAGSSSMPQLSVSPNAPSNQANVSCHKPVIAVID